MKKSLFQQAFDSKVKSERLLDKAVQEIVRKKGFSDDQVLNFGASWTTGCETVVTYKDRGEFSDLDARFLESMTKEEIIARLSQYEENLFEEEL